MTVVEIYEKPLESVMSKPRPKLLSDWVKEPVTEIIKFWQQEVEESEPKEIGQGFEVPLAKQKLKRQRCWQVGDCMLQMRPSSKSRTH